jgi:uncharacterized protein YjdB
MARTPSTRGSGHILAPQELLRFPDDVLARVPAGQAEDHLLLAGFRGLEITVYLPFPLEANPGDGVTLLVNGDPVGEEVIVDPYWENEDDIPLPLPATARATDATYPINYRLTLHSGEGQTSTGPDHQQFVVDYTPPGAPAVPGSPSIEKPQFAPEIIADAVTLERLTTDNDGNTYLPASVKAYHGQAVGDRLLGYIDGEVATEVREILDGETDDAIELRYTLAALEKLENGRHGFKVEVVDRAENPPGFSEPVELMVRLRAVIPNPLPARVPSAVDGLVNHDDAHRPGGVQVDIPASSLVLPGDAVVVAWADYRSDPYPIEAGSESNDPLLSLFVPYEEVYKAWLAISADSDQRVSTEVNYVILRGGEFAGTPDNPTIVTVNLYVPGGVDPDPENPEHGALWEPMVYSATGSENFIPLDEQQLDGLVEVRWESRLSDRTVFILDDILTVRFGNTTLSPPYVVDDTDVSAGKPLRLRLPKEAIAAESARPVVVSYTIERPLTGGGSNIAISPSQDVKVEDQTDLPGGGILAAGSFTEVNEHLTLGPTQIQGGTLFVGDYADRRAGDTIRFEFQLVKGYAHNGEELPIPERFHRGEIVLAVDGDPIEYLIAEEHLNYHDLPPQQMHIHATYHAWRGMSSEAHSPTTTVLLDCRGMPPPFTIDTSPVRLIRQGEETREAVNGFPPYTYVSSDPNIVKVPDEHVGLIAGVSDGKASVTASDTGGSSRSYPVTVVGNTPFTIDPSTVRILGHGIEARSAAGGVPPYTYTSNAPDVVKVPDPYQGIIQGAGDGDAIVTARDSDLGVGSYPVIVVGNAPFSIDPSPIQLIGVATDTRSAVGGAPPYTYTSSAPSVVQVPKADEGLIKSVVDGNATITARDSDHGVASYPVIVVGNTPFSIDPSPVQLISNATDTRDAAGGVPPYTYTSSAPGVVEVPKAGEGVIKGVADGSATITARDSHQGAGSYPVIVVGNTPFSIDPSLVQLTGTATDTRNAVGGVPPYSYASSAPRVVEVPEAGEGRIRGVTDGRATITARDSRHGVDSYPVVVAGNTQFSLDPSRITLSVGGSDARSASGGVPPYTYASSSPGVVRVPDAGQGTIQGVAPGDANVTASDTDGNSKSYPVTVIATPPPFFLDPSPVTLAVGESKTRSASGGIPPYTYASSSPGVVGVPHAGQGTIQGVAAGNANITASDKGGGSKSYPVTVAASPKPLSIDQTPMALTGAIYRNAVAVTNPPAGAYGIRQASGGVPPYRYRAENPAVVDVDAVSGRVVSRATGSTRVIATDAASQQVAYAVSAANIFMVFGTGVFGTYTQCRQGAERGGGRLLTRAEWNYVRASHGNVTGCGTQIAWTNDQTHVGKRWAINPDAGTTIELIDFGIGGQTAVGWGIKGV